ncbi:MAG: DUF4271 domain-containing protein [Chitinophagaceae bacterium]|nr:DUF4271 domain-containing protein [Chitinophagaceae bacterium]MCW5903971.1 DUF4271 domain-containing protein [Chitinophagaceae bacterium]
MLSFLQSNLLLAQTDTTTSDSLSLHKKPVNDSPIIKKTPIVPKPILDTVPLMNDSIPLNDTTTEHKDSLQQVAVTPLIKKDTSTFAAIMHHKYFPINNNRIFMISPWQSIENKDTLFYSLLLLVGILAIIKLSFSKYFSNLFKQIFQLSNKQRQTQEQIVQDNLPSLLMNILFVLSGGMFIALVVERYRLVQANFWLLLLYSSVLLLIVYFIKYLFLLFSGWIFNMSNATNTYTFIVFLINKIVGILFIPIIFIIAFASNTIAEIGITITTFLLAFLFMYRYWLSYKAVRNNIKVSALHFFLYLCAVEILPLAILYKAVFNIIQG